MADLLAGWPCRTCKRTIWAGVQCGSCQATELLVHRNEAGLLVASQMVVDEHLRNVGGCTMDLAAEPAPPLTPDPQETP